jgi:hypothetical protein
VSAAVKPVTTICCSIAAPPSANSDTPELDASGEYQIGERYLSLVAVHLYRRRVDKYPKVQHAELKRQGRGWVSANAGLKETSPECVRSM